MKKFKNPFTINVTNRLFCKIIRLKKKSDINKNQTIKFYGYTEYPLIALNEFRKMNLKMLPLNRQVGRWEGARREQLTC